jgi:hypothetical protein
MLKLNSVSTPASTLVCKTATIKAFDADIYISVHVLKDQCNEHNTCFRKTTLHLNHTK